MIIDLKRKRAIVCGSTQGIGKAIAIRLAQSNADITLVARNEEKLQEVLKELKTEPGQKHNYLVADFDYPDLLEEKINSYLNRAKQADILINNTGGPPSGKVIDAGIEEFNKAFNNHIICNHILVKAVLPYMSAKKSGRIINIISTSVKMPIPDLGVSNTIRGAVASWSKTLSDELGPFGITVNNILPGSTNTTRIESLIASKSLKQNKTKEEVRKMMEEDVPLKRFAEPEEIAHAVAFLASEEAAYINGINLPVDGGRTACL
ncbi:MAG: SDR family oxidoreductase [Bacteroidota bacterium]|nr:SDR family oxidoreductase [Bacteroidota bacterium]